ncbi:MAG: hypothetical protein IJW03_05735, partial [Clostridia bacterium]|nr:hypothetical protein [Clostridia bacterium]
KAEGFRKTDGGYSYYLEHSASSIQGVYASRGYAEGDLNATCLLVYHMIGYMEGAFGVQLPAIWNITDYRRFLNEIDNLEPIEKKAGVSEINCDFERYSVDDTPQNDGIVADNGTGSCKIEADPDDSTNNVLALNSPANSATGYKIRPNFIKTKNCFVFEADLNIPEKSSGTTHQISLYTGSERYYMLTLGGNEDSISIGDASNVTSTVTPEGKVNPISQSFGASVPTGEWFKLKLEVYETTDDGFSVKIFLNNEYIYTSNNYFEKELGTEPLLSGAVTMVWVYNLIKPSATLLADNIKMYYTDTEYVDGGGSSSDSEAYDFESSNVKVGSNLHSTGAKAELTTAENIDGDDSGVYHLSKTNTDGWDQLSFKMPSAIDEGSVVSISMDIKFNNFSGGGAQLAFGALDADAYYMLGMTSSGTNISIYDSSTMKSGVTATKNNYSKTMSVGKWHTLLVELYVTENSRNFSATIYLDGVRVATSTNYYNYDGATDVPNISLDFIHLRFVKATSVDVYLDNVVIECE